MRFGLRPLQHFTDFSSLNFFQFMILVIFGNMCALLLSFIFWLLFWQSLWLQRFCRLEIGNIGFLVFQTGIQDFFPICFPSNELCNGVSKEIYVTVLSIPHNTYKWAKLLKKHG
jgi:hypothetical protein